ncbi:His-Phos-2 domain containing protein [Pyrenophora tritici-repentis]|nr:His Phos 2 domain containing protein [Pyrenophora tritici-repentis]KAI0591180.1 His-Phos-2 domain-containing protein [Pyrenophora tritici-repentis]KAI0626274.1 His-Phos-2 domain-containing protein [Pyrenophora tritici-repentis]KAI1555142.1 His-Phos-2 domain containing protein [Pyrenophora tritici-repentis]KAI2487992.1 His Phos 2 domain containing protein [Pyrenophora tritici-repentis]
MKMKMFVEKTTVAVRGAAFVALLVGVGAAPGMTTMTVPAATDVGANTADVYPPASTAVNSSLFPPESVVGFPGPTPTGAEPFAIQTAPAYPYNDGSASSYPLILPQPHGSGSQSPNLDIAKYWGNLSPWYSVRSADYGLPDASPLIPDGCEITQMHLLYRHGARYPTSDAAPAKFAQKIVNATKTDGLAFSGELEWLANWKYKLGAELLTPSGRSENFMLGVEYRQLYGHLLNNFTESGKIPVFRTESQDRMVHTAENFAAGFFGVPEYMSQVNIELLVETLGVNNSGAPYEICNNSNIASRGSIGSKVASDFAHSAFNATLARLQSQVEGITLTSTDAIAMLQLCSPVAAAQGKGFLDEFIARFTQTYPQANSALNETFDNSSTYFPLDQSIYADATHEVVVLDVLTAFNLTALFKGGPLSGKGNEGKSAFVASKVVPFATHFTTQVMECRAMVPTKQIRFIVNDAVLPIDGSYPGCPDDANGLCSFDNVVDMLKKRSAEIDFE